MSRTRTRAPNTSLADHGDLPSRKFVSVQNDAYQEDFLRQNLAPGSHIYLRSPSGYQAQHMKNHRTREADLKEPQNIQKYEEIRQRSSNKKGSKPVNHPGFDYVRNASQIAERPRQDSLDRERVSKLNLNKLGGQQGKVEIKFIADSFRGDLISERHQKQRDAMPNLHSGVNQNADKHAKMALSDEQYDELMNHYQELLECTIPQTLKHFLKTPTLFADIVGVIMSTTNEFVDQKINETLQDLARVLGIESSNRTLLDILVKYPNGLSHLQPKEEHQIVEDIAAKASKIINTGKLY